MSVQFVSEDYDPDAKRERCIACGTVSIPKEHVEKGPICRNCVVAATEIRVSLVIRGLTYTKQLKGRISVVEGAKKGKTPARANATEVGKETTR
jgi:hypothetical protein